jgi:hypothetical protein
MALVLGTWQRLVSEFVSGWAKHLPDRGFSQLLPVIAGLISPGAMAVASGRVTFISSCLLRGRVVLLQPPASRRCTFIFLFSDRSQTPGFLCSLAAPSFYLISAILFCLILVLEDVSFFFSFSFPSLSLLCLEENGVCKK